MDNPNESLEGTPTFDVDADLAATAKDWEDKAAPKVPDIPSVKRATCRHPEVHVDLEGVDGNAVIIIGHVCRALRRARVPRGDIEVFKQEAKSGGYDDVLATCARWVDC